ncbi:hypothetical protein HKX48_008180 [Thoreauomyces humboldtii]|nr:hypothetical protein HKX48_008180 [Thoreauomyces humboldtii]
MARLPAAADLPPLQTALQDVPLTPHKVVEDLTPALSVQSQEQAKGTGQPTVAGKGDGKKIPLPVSPPQWLSQRQIWLHATQGGIRSFLLAYGMRGGIAFLIKLFRVLNGKASVRSAFHSFFALDSARFGGMIGSFAFLWKLINNMLHFRTGKTCKTHGFVAGAVAGGVAILFEKRETRISIAQQFAVRSLQASYNALKARDIVHLPHGDSALFMGACASIMYAYCMQPNTIPREYYAWMVKMARVPNPILTFNRTQVRAFEKSRVLPDTADAMVKVITGNRGGHVPELVGRALTYLKENGGALPIVPCSVMHPTDVSHAAYNFKVACQVAKDIAPVYAALNFVPMLLLKPQTFAKNPAALTARNIRATLRSTLFLVVYVVVFQSGICLQRSIATSPSSAVPAFLRRDHRGFYYILGLIASSSIFLEQKGRRAELAMYVLPKGLQSLWLVLHQRGCVFKVPYFEVWMASGAMGMLMSLYQAEPHRMSTLLFKVMEKTIGRN